MVATGQQIARIELIPEGEEHPRWDEVRDFISALGVVLDPWQERVLWASLLRRSDDWAAFTVAVCCPRQNGKNGILEIRELIGPLVLGEKFIIHSAHRADTSKEAFRRLEDLLDANEWLSKEVRHIWRTNGHEALEFKGGRRIRFRTRTRSGGRGFSGSPVILDEAMFLSEDSMAALVPVLTAQPNPQIWYTGSAVDQLSMDEGIVFARVRDQALGGEAERLAYFEWSLDADTPEDVGDAVASDPETWAATNPALGIRITTDYLEAEQRSLDRRTFAVERLGVGDWPRTDGKSSVIDLDIWERLADRDSKALDPVVLAFDVRPSRSRSVIAVAGKRKDRKIHLEVIENRDGTGWIVERLVELRERHEPLAIVCDGVGPASSLIPELLASDVKVRALTTQEMGHACAMLYDAVQQEQIRHLGTPDLLSAIKGAASRPLGDAWAWSRRNSSSDISPLVAVTLALWGVNVLDALEPFFVAA